MTLFMMCSMAHSTKSLLASLLLNSASIYCTIIEISFLSAVIGSELLGQLHVVIVGFSY